MTDVPQAYQADRQRAAEVMVIMAAKRMSSAASELKTIEGMNLEPDELSDAWDHAYAKLYRANEEFLHAYNKAYFVTSLDQPTRIG